MLTPVRKGIRTRSAIVNRTPRGRYEEIPVVTNPSSVTFHSGELADVTVVDRRNGVI